MSSMKANNTTQPSSAYTIHPVKVYANEKYLLVSECSSPNQQALHFMMLEKGLKTGNNQGFKTLI